MVVGEALGITTLVFGILAVIAVCIVEYIEWLDKQKDKR